MKKTLAAIAVGFTLLMGATSASAKQIYNGLSTPSKTPDKQGWTYLGTQILTSPSAQATSGGTILDTGNISNYSGYFYNNPLVDVKLDRAKGYSITFSVKINAETHSKDNRAGCSLIVISNTLAGETQPYGIEIAFFKDKIWAQDSTFTTPNPAESASFNTQADGINYNLIVQGDKYQLFASGSVTPIITGKLRQYSFTPPAGFPNPYKIPNLIFIGDNTTSATANVTIKNVYATPLGEVTGSTTGGK